MCKYLITNPLHIGADFCYTSIMNWAGKRRLQYLGGIFVIFLIVIFILIYPLIFKDPTCTDGKKNGDEVGVDCGGSCLRMCQEKTSDPVILWSRAFPVVGNTYNLVAFIENQNRNSGIIDIAYEFRIYDVDNKLIGRRQGNTFIPPNKQFAIFEPRIDFREREVKSVSFEFTGPLNWIRKEPTLNNLSLYVDKITMGQDKKNPSLTAIIKNESIYDIPPFEVITILYDEQKNAINASKTVKDGLRSNDSLSVFFTWPEVFKSDPVTEDVLVLINPFTVPF